MMMMNDDDALAAKVDNELQVIINIYCMHTVYGLDL